MRILSIAIVLLFTVTAAAGSQSPGAEMSAGDREYRAMRAESALQHYERVLTAEPDSYEALWKASRSALDLASGPLASDERRLQLFKAGERYARKSVELRPGEAEGYFALARALGKASQSLGVRDKVRHATAIRKNALNCIRLDPRHSGCHHIMGVWNAEVMRLGGLERVIARNFLGGRALGSASWPNAQRYLEQAVELAPERIIHHLELGDVYRDRGNKPAARNAYETVMRLGISDYNDERYKSQAGSALRALR